MATAEPADPYDSAACGLLSIALDGRVRRVNATFCGWVGWDASELVGRKRFQDLLTVGSKLFHQTHWMPLLQLQGSVAEVQLDLLARDGRTLSAMVNATLQSGAPAQQPEARCIHVAVFIATDRRKYERELLLARRRAEELLASERDAQRARALAEERLHLALDSAQLHTWSLELPSGVTVYERGVGALLGRPDLPQVTAEVYAAAVHVDDRERERAAFARALDPQLEELYATEYRLQGLDGIERIIRATGRGIFEDGGRVVGFTGMLEDVTARRRAETALRVRETEFRMLAENSPDIIARFDPAHRVVYLNHSVQRLSGVPVASLLGKRVEEVPPLRETAAAWHSALDTAFAGSDATLAFSHQAENGAHYDFQARLVPERDAHGQVLSALAITRDVTAIKAAEREAQQRAVLAEHFVGIVSHDLRNPLNAVLLGTHVLRASELTPQHARVVGRIASSAERATRLVADLLDFTQARLGGGLRVSPREADVHTLVADCVEELRLAWPGRMLVVRTRGAGLGHFDPDRISQVAGNLASNALTYGAPEQPITITSCVYDDTLELHVHNQGRPISSELLPHIFEPMRRGEQSVKLGSRSIGLGLYIVSEIVSAHAGSVTVTSTEAEGTTFLVRLPRGPRPQAAGTLGADI
jgi:sigma-B regulation protein RsbU (phosphoserine phosphatase)